MTADSENSNSLMYLSEEHRAELQSSGLSDKTIKAWRCYTVDNKGLAGQLGFPGADVPALALPLITPDKLTVNPDFCVLKPYTLPISGKGRKYLWPKSRPNRIHAPLAIRDKLLDPSVTLIITEGQKKAEKAAQEGLCVLAVPGVYSWLTKIGERSFPLGDFDLFPIKGRNIVIAFDSDAVNNKQVKAAERDLAAFLTKRGASVRIKRFQPGPNGEKVGLDDFLLTNTYAEFWKVPEAVSDVPATTPGLIVSENGNPKALLANVVIKLQESLEWRGVIWYDDFSLYAVARKTTPWGKQPDTKWTDYDDSETAVWMQRNGIYVNSKTVNEAVQMVSQQNPFHPVKIYLESLDWDGQPRINRWLSVYFGAEADTEELIRYVSAVGSCWLISGVARIYQPGCQVDHTLLLEGPQGIYKSTGIKTVVGERWFIDHISDLDNKDARIELHGVWVVELAELSNVRRSVSEKVKSFLTARVDHFRPPYGRRAMDVPRSNIFAGSVNDSTPFTDETGNRRFWPINCGKIDVHGLEEIRDQLWAEALVRYQRGEAWWFEDEALKQLASQEQDKRYDPGYWDDAIEKWLEDREAVTVAEVLTEALKIPEKDFDRAAQMQVARCLKHAGWKVKVVWEARNDDDRKRAIRKWVLETKNERIE